jgi:hypothetical protein
VPSSGRSRRPHGITTKRVHHLLSDIERDLFYLFDWDEDVEDLREQFPLDREVTQRMPTNWASTIRETVKAASRSS